MATEKTSSPADNTAPAKRGRPVRVQRLARIALLTTPAHKEAMVAAADLAGQSITTYVMRAAIAGGMVRP
jgi:hypothetical protein